MSFQRQGTDFWKEDIPGARWFKSDLHVHTIEDSPSSRLKVPPDIPGKQYSKEWMHHYARKFLQALISSGIEVAGLTPHAARMPSGDACSGIWSILTEWNEGVDDDAIPFREKIYAVFPGFEPSLHAGPKGLHLLILFDPEIGKEQYLKAFDMVMGGVDPWQSRGLSMSPKRPEHVFKELRQFHCGSTDSNNDWHYLILAPHVDAETGLLGALKSQALQFFEHAEIAGLELGDDKLPQDSLKKRPWLSEGMQTHGQAFFHASDAYTLDKIGDRFTWVKMGTSRIDALRLAFIASESRIRSGFKRAPSGTVRRIEYPCDKISPTRPWLKEVTVRGAASFFGGTAKGTRFQFSPDLTCVLGGSMTGKSTLLDGLRILAGAPFPEDPAIKANVQARARKFEAGNAEITFQCPGAQSKAPFGEQWPAMFFSQNELQRLSGDTGDVQELVSRLAPNEGTEIEKLTRELQTHDAELKNVLQNLNRLEGTVAESEQSWLQAKRAKEALMAYSKAGVDRLHLAVKEREAWKEAETEASNLRQHLETAVTEYLDSQSIQSRRTGVFGFEGTSEIESDISQGWQEIAGAVKEALEKLGELIRRIHKAGRKASSSESILRVEIMRALAEQGFGAERLEEFAALSRHASLLPSFEAERGRAHTRWNQAETQFKELLSRRMELTNRLRNAFDRAIDSLSHGFGKRIRVRRIDEGHREHLGEFLRTLRQKGVTRWWNDLSNDSKPSSEKLLSLFNSNALDSVGMSNAVQTTFKDCLTGPRKRELEAIYCRDRYYLEMLLNDGIFRPLSELSGGQRVSVLLALLLEAKDHRPLVIDQPEDELDNSFLSESVLPALRRLKGKRQVILATHNANIVVNGDADLVIHLQATADHGSVNQMGVIEEPRIRDTIVNTVDGGAEAFQLRLRKYGY